MLAFIHLADAFKSQNTIHAYGIASDTAGWIRPTDLFRLALPNDQNNKKIILKWPVHYYTFSPTYSQQHSQHPLFKEFQPIPHEPTFLKVFQPIPHDLTSLKEFIPTLHDRIDRGGILINQTRPHPQVEEFWSIPPSPTNHRWSHYFSKRNPSNPTLRPILWLLKEFWSIPHDGDIPSSPERIQSNPTRSHLRSLEGFQTNHTQSHHLVEEFWPIPPLTPEGILTNHTIPPILKGIQTNHTWSYPLLEGIPTNHMQSHPFRKEFWPITHPFLKEFSIQSLSVDQFFFFFILH